MHLAGGMLGPIFSFFWARKLWWMVPLLGVIVLFVALIVMASFSGNGPFDYSLF